MLTVPRLSDPDPATVRREFFAARRPVVLAGAVAGSKAFRNWDPGYLRAAAGARVVVAWYLPDGVVRADPAAGLLVRRVKGPLADLIDRLDRPAGPGGCFYIAQRSLKRGPTWSREPELPELAADMPDLPAAAGRELVVANFWMSAGEPVTGLHYDFSDNVLAVVRGRKRVLLFPPAETRNLYPFPVSADTPHLSCVDPDAPDPRRFPRYRPGRGVAVDVGPGDALYIPAFWWHHVKSYGLNVAVNFWYRNVPGTTAGLLNNPSRGYYLKRALHESAATARAAAGRWLARACPGRRG